MTNVSGTPLKRATRRGLFEFAVQTLEQQGWKVERIRGGGKASLRRITRGGESFKVSIRTSQDGWIAFPRKGDNSGWVTLDDVDYVVASSVNERHNPTHARVHMIPGEDARARFDRALEARKKADHVLHLGRGIWLSLYDSESANPVSHVGAGMGLSYPALETLDLRKSSLPRSDAGHEDSDTAPDDEEAGEPEDADSPLTIPEAKRRLALTLGVPEAAIKILIEH